MSDLIDTRDTIVDPPPWWRRALSFIGHPLHAILHALRPPAPPVLDLGVGAPRSAFGERILLEILRVPRQYATAAVIVGFYRAHLERQAQPAPIDGRVHFALSRLPPGEDGAISIARLGQVLFDIPSPTLKRALRRLEADGIVELMPGHNDDDNAVIRDEVRGSLARVELRRPLC